MPAQDCPQLTKTKGKHKLPFCLPPNGGAQSGMWQGYRKCVGNGGIPSTAVSLFQPIRTLCDSTEDRPPPGFCFMLIQEEFDFKSHK